MDGLDIFDLSTEELMQELAAIGRDESLRWRLQLILQELQDRQGYEDLAGQLEPLSDADTQYLQSLNVETRFSAPLLALSSLLDQDGLLASEAPLGVRVTQQDADRDSKGSEQGLEESENRQYHLEKDFSAQAATKMLSSERATFQLQNPRGSQTARGAVLRELVIGSCPVALSPRRRSSQRRMSTGSGSQVRPRTHPERDKVELKAGVGSKARAGKAIAITPAIADNTGEGQATERRPPKRVSSTKKVIGSELGSRTEEEKTGRSPLESMEPSKASAASDACSFEVNEQPAASTISMEAPSNMEEESRIDVASEEECSTSRLQGNGVVERAFPAEAENCASLGGNAAQGLIEEHPTLEESPFEQEVGDLCAGGLEHPSSITIDERSIEEDCELEVPQKEKFPSPDSPSIESIGFVSETSPGAPAGFIEESVLGECISDLRASTSIADSERGELEPVAASVVEEMVERVLACGQSQFETVSPVESKRAKSMLDQDKGTAEHSALLMDPKVVAPVSEQASVALSSNDRPAANQTQAKPGPLTRFDQIFARYAPGTVTSKEASLRPAPALQHFYQEMALSLEADAQLKGEADTQTLRKEPETNAGASKASLSSGKTTNRLILRCDAGEHSEVADLMTAFGRTSKSWAVDTASESSTWNVLWTWVARPRVDYNELLVWQKVNHFPHSKQLTRKDLLKGHLARHSRAANALMPTTFTLPREYVAFVRAFSDGRTDVSDPAEKTSEKENESEDSVGLETSIAECENMWIMKPVGKSRGQGIFLVSDICHVAYGEAMVVQKYIERPLLIHGHKFDLRLYVMVTSFNPLEAFLYQEGFARFASRPYTRSAVSLTDMLVHLTNTEVQKGREHVPNFLHASSLQQDTCPCQLADGDSPNENCGVCRIKYGDGLSAEYVEDKENLQHPRVNIGNHCETLVDTKENPEPAADELLGNDVRQEQLIKANKLEREGQVNGRESLRASTSYGSLDGGCKVSLSRAFGLMTSHGVDVDRLWKKISNLVLQSLEAVQIAIPANRNCFEVFGYDVLIDELQRPWLVEVNSSPSMETGTPLDCALKGALIRDTLQLVDPIPFDRNFLAAALRRRSTPQPSVKRTDRSSVHDPDLLPDLDKILKTKQQRRFGELPVHLGNYQRIAPPLGSQKRAGR